MLARVGEKDLVTSQPSHTAPWFPVIWGPPLPPFLASLPPATSAVSPLPSSCESLSQSLGRDFWAMPQLESGSVYQQKAMSTPSGSFGFFLLLPTTLPQACHPRLLLVRTHHLCLPQQVRKSIQTALCILMVICRPSRGRHTARSKRSTVLAFRIQGSGVGSHGYSTRQTVTGYPSLRPLFSSEMR